MVYSLCDGDLSKAGLIENRPVEETYRYYYLKRVENLNFKRSLIAERKRLKALEDKRK